MKRECVIGFVLGCLAYALYTATFAPEALSEKVVCIDASEWVSEGLVSENDDSLVVRVTENAVVELPRTVSITEALAVAMDYKPTILSAAKRCEP